MKNEDKFQRQGGMWDTFQTTQRTYAEQRNAKKSCSLAIPCVYTLHVFLSNNFKINTCSGIKQRRGGREGKRKGLREEGRQTTTAGRCAGGRGRHLEGEEEARGLQERGCHRLGID